MNVAKLNRTGFSRKCHFRSNVAWLKATWGLLREEARKLSEVLGWNVLLKPPNCDSVERKIPLFPYISLNKPRHALCYFGIIQQRLFKTCLEHTCNLHIANSHISLKAFSSDGHSIQTAKSCSFFKSVRRTAPSIIPDQRRSPWSQSKECLPWICFIWTWSTFQKVFLNGRYY